MNWNITRHHDGTFHAESGPFELRGSQDGTINWKYGTGRQVEDEDDYYRTATEEFLEGIAPDVEHALSDMQSAIKQDQELVLSEAQTRLEEVETLTLPDIESAPVQPPPGPPEPLSPMEQALRDFYVPVLQEQFARSQVLFDLLSGKEPVEGNRLYFPIQEVK